MWTITFTEKKKKVYVCGNSRERVKTFRFFMSIYRLNFADWDQTKSDKQ